MKTTHLLSIAAFGFGLVACKEKTKTHEPQAFIETNSFGLNVPVILIGDTNTIVLEDFYDDVSLIDSIMVPPHLATNWVKGENEVVITGRTVDALAPVSIFSQGKVTEVLLRNPAIETVTLTFNPEGKSYNAVSLVGDLNGWNAEADPFTFDGTNWVLEKQMNPGGYAYQLALDGVYHLDPNNPDSVPNGFGAFNSFLKVEASNLDKIPHLTVASANGTSITINSTVANAGWYALWQNQIIKHGNGAISIEIPAIAKELDRSYIRVWAESEFGLSNEIRIPLDHGKVIEKADQLARTDVEKNIMYFMLVDRFVNGDTSIDEPVEDDRIKPRANYYGGDLAGVKQKLDEGYFDELGINTLWISPITQNPLGAYQEYPEPRRWFSGYHGYWPVSFKKVDHRFGSNELLKTLVNETHAKDYNIILDYVCNHVHEEHPFIQQHPDWKTTLNLPDGRRNLRIWDEFRLTTWFDDFLPTLDYSIPEVTEIMSDSAVWWMEEFGFDGFRHDATKHIPESFWRANTRKLRQLSQQTGQDYFQVGETFGSRDLIQSYIGSGMMDGQFDFNLYFDAVNVFKDTTAPMSKLQESLMASQNLHGSLHKMCNITGNHDLTRFISLASGAVRDDEDQKEAGWSREIKVENPVGYDRLKMLETFIMTIPGIPVIFYGDEIGMPGANDPDNRRMMRFENLNPEEQNVKAHVEAITRIRANHMALIFGDLNILQADDHTLVYSRQYLNDEVITLFNQSEKPIKVSVPVNASTLESLNSTLEYTIENGKLTTTLPAHSSQILYTKA